MKISTVSRMVKMHPLSRNAKDFNPLRSSESPQDKDSVLKSCLNPKILTQKL